MKIRRSDKLASSGSRRNRGTAVIVVIALFAIMMLFLGMSLRCLNYLWQDLKIIERQQLQRIRQSPAVNNAATATNAPKSVELSATNSSALFSKP